MQAELCTSPGIKRSMKALASIVMLALVVGLSIRASAEVNANAGASVAEGRYVVITSGCNDCHTKGWTATAAKIPESEWLAGDLLGWSGPWGTTYPPNLRILISNISEDNWVKLTRTLQARPPMPWWALRYMTESDVRSVYRFVNNLGPKGGAVPSYLPPGVKPNPPYFLLVTE
jgi:uncharacterized membrane protein